MQQLPQQNSECQNRWSFIHACFSQLHCIAFIAAIVATPVTIAAIKLPSKNETHLKHKTPKFIHKLSNYNIQAQINQDFENIINFPSNQTPFQLTQPQEKSGMELKISDVVILVLANNRDIKNAYLERIAQRKDLAVAEDKFAPDFTPTLSFSLNQAGGGGLATGRLGMNIDAKVAVKIPTGGELSFGWAGNAQTSNSNDLSVNSNDDSLRQNFELNFRQPLLRGAGIAVNKASINIARIDEKINILALQSTLSDTITKAILAYRELLQAQERLKIQQLALKNAQESLEITQILINAGRIAPVEIVQNQTDIANKQVDVLAAENDLEAKKLGLIQLLDIDKNTNIVASGIPTIQPINLDLEKLKKTALENQPEYLQAQLNLDKNKLDLMLAENERRWDLNLDAGVANATNDSADMKVGLSLTRKIGDLSIEQKFERSRVNLFKAQNSLEDSRETLEIQVTDRIRDINLSLSQLELARNATQLSERQLAIEQEKLKLGRSNNLDIINLQNALAQARNNELNATIAYLNALTNLDQILGTTLQTWQVTIK
jgi:outer membrane protein TolC